jgi:hypothetical protein
MLRKLALATMRLYTGVALVVLNVIVALIVLNGVAAVILAQGSSPSHRPKDPSEEAALAAVFPNLTHDEIRRLVDETGRFSYTFEPYTQFRDRPRQGRYVNIDSVGFRYSAHQASWPPSPDYLNVFVFGGSTTFGWLVPDDFTIPSYLQSEIAALTGEHVAIYNFGRTNYIATQERILFEQLLMQGHRPDIAIFIDGCNDTYYLDGVPAFTERLAQVVDGRLPSPLTRFALYRAALRLRTAIMERRAPALPQDSARNAQRRSDAADAVVTRYAANKQLTLAMAEAYGVTAFFVWQPVPGFRYDLRHHPQGQAAARRLSSMADIYSRMEARLRSTANSDSLGRNLIWCADIQKDLAEALYLDIVHYTPDMSKRVAQCIAREAHARGLFIRPSA